MLCCFLLFAFLWCGLKCAGELITTLDKHKGPLSSLKWNENGDFLLSGSFDRTAVVWDTKTWQRKQRFKYHSGNAIHSRNKKCSKCVPVPLSIMRSSFL